MVKEIQEHNMMEEFSYIQGVAERTEMLPCILLG